MKAFLYGLAVLVCIGGSLVIIGMVETSSSTSTAAKAHPYSNESIDALELSKNPYELQGHSGILDPRLASYKWPNGMQGAMALPGGALVFEKMLDANLATFEVETIGYTIERGGELAVELDDSHPPDPTRPWRVTVEEPLNGTNAFGQELTISAVHFDGYVALAPTALAPVRPTAARPPAAPATNQSQQVTKASEEQAPAPIIRVAPSSTSDQEGEGEGDSEPPSSSDTDTNSAASAQSPQ